MCKACGKTSESSEMPGNGIIKDDQDVSDDPSPLLHDPLITEAINRFKRNGQETKRHWAGMRRARLPIKIDARVLPRGLGGPRVESTVVVF
jgi:hypothetical protein